ncbi:hypothetical protein [Streptomyces prasinus]|uniref:hypothetical protein n=1 Tax=Streptomyces prasinus TaxID=67345 RepID=UPI000AD90FD6|nr:hypothetical protein [Streptomyces prasinus]
MTPARARSTVSSDSQINPERKPLAPAVEPILGSSEEGRTAGRKPQTPEVPDSQTHGVPDSRTSAVPDSRSYSDPKWTTLERKEARLRADQLTDLAELRRHVNSQRRDRSEIITDNTLIRVAVDLLLERSHRLRGDTEEDLRESVLPRRRPAAAPEENS